MHDPVPQASRLLLLLMLTAALLVGAASIRTANAQDASAQGSSLPTAQQVEQDALVQEQVPRAANPRAIQVRRRAELRQQLLHSVEEASGEMERLAHRHEDSVDAANGMRPWVYVAGGTALALGVTAAVLLLSSGDGSTDGGEETGVDIPRPPGRP